MSRRRKRASDVPALPFTVDVSVGSHRVHVTFADDALSVRHVEHHGDPAAVSGADRERLTALVVRDAILDPKIDHERIYAALWSV